MSEYQYYEFLAVDRPLDERQQAELRALSTRARITATSFTNEYHWGNFRGDPRKMMERYYDAHLYLTNWGTHQVMLRLPRALLSLEVAEQYCIDPHVAAWASGEHLILDLTSEDESGDWVEGAEDSLSAIVGVRAELAAGDLRPLYLAWLAAYGTWERDEDAFGYTKKTNSNHRCPPAWESSPPHSAPWPTSSGWTPTCSRSQPRRARRWPRRKTSLASWPDGSKTCRPATRTPSSTRLPKAMAPKSRWNCGAGSAVSPTPAATAVPGAEWPNSWTPPPKPVTSASGGPKPCGSARLPHAPAASSAAPTTSARPRP
jgi:hypothetical protein